MKEVVEQSAAAFPPNRRKRILVVEEETTARMFLLNQLKKAGLEIDTAANGGIAFKKLKDSYFDAIIIDLALADMKGQDLVKEIRKNQVLANLLIFVCASAQRPDPWRGRGVKAGVTRVFDKGTSTVDAVVADIVAHLIPKSKETAHLHAKGQDTERHAGSKPASPAKALEDAGSQTAFTPLPTGQSRAGAAAASPSPPPAEGAASATTGKTGFFHNPTPLRATDTALLRKAAIAGQAAAAKSAASAPTPAPPALRGDTELVFPPASEDVPAPKAPTPPAEVQAAPAPHKERFGLAERIIAPFKMLSSRSETSLHGLKKQLAEVTRHRDELLALLRDHPIFGSTAPGAGNAEGLVEAKAAANRAEAAYQAELARSKQFEEELKRIREARDELNRKLAEEEQAAAESRRRSKELEERLEESTSELDEVKTELQKHVSEHSRLEGELRQQLNSTRESADIAKVAYQEQASLAVRSTEELAFLQKAREELNAQLNAEMKAATDSKRRAEEREQQLREKEAEVERLKSELAHGSSPSELAERLGAAQMAAQSAERAYKEEAARGALFEKDLERLQEAREELNERLAREEQAAAEARRRSEEMEQQLAARTGELERVKAELDRHAEERKTLESELQQQLAAAKAAAEQARSEFQQETSQFQRSKEEADALRQARDELNAKLEGEQQAAASSRRHSEELEGKLQATAEELAQLRAELEKHVSERATLVTASNRQLQAAKTAATKAEKAYQAQLKRSAKFQKELAALRQDRAPSSGKQKAEKSTKSTRRVKELEGLAAQQAAELESARKDLEKLQAERERLEAECRQFSEAPRPAPAPEGSDAASSEGRFRESISALARATAQLEKERGERRRVEQRAAFLSGQLENLHEELRRQLEIEKENHQRVAEFEQHLRDRQKALAKAESDLEKEAAARQLVEAELKARSGAGNQWQEHSNLVDEAKRVFNAVQEKLEARLQEALAMVKQTQTKLQKQTADRKKLEASLEDAQRKLQERSTEVARLQVEGIERRKLEGHSMQSRYTSLDASRLGRAFVNSFRTHLRPSAEHLLQAARRLLELPLEEEHKKLVEELLEDALLLRTSMQDDARLPGEGDAPEAAKAA